MNTAQLRRAPPESFAHYRPGLIQLLLDAVRQGASLGFLADLDTPQAQVYFNEVHQAIELGQLLLWVVVENEQVLASVQLALCQKANGRNRAEVQKLLVLHAHRRRGLGQQLMTALEQTARQLQRGLLYLDTEAGSPAEQFYQAQGYQCIGGLPDYACGPDGTYRANAIYYKTLSRPAL